MTWSSNSLLITQVSLLTLVSCSKKTFAPEKEDVGGGRVAISLRGQYKLSQTLPVDDLMGAVFAPDDGHIFAANAESFQIFSTLNSSERKFVHSRVEAFAIAVSSDRTKVAVAEDRVIRLLDPNAATTLQQLSLPQTGQSLGSLSFSPDGKQLASAFRSIRRPNLILWDIGSGQPAKDLYANFPGFPEAVAYAPDGQYIASGHYGGGVILWRNASPGSGTQTRTLWASMTDRFEDGVETKSIAFSPDSRLLATLSDFRFKPSRDSAGSNSVGLQIWDLTQANVRRMEPLENGAKGDKQPIVVASKAVSLAFSPDGTVLAVAAHDFSEEQRRFDAIKLLDTKTWQTIQTLVPNAYVEQFSFSANGDIVLAAAPGGIVDQIQVWRQAP